MNKYVKVKYNGKISAYLLCVDDNHTWTDEQIKSENAKAVSVAKMAFLDHGEPMISGDFMPTILQTKAAYVNKPKDGNVLLIYEGGQFMTLLPEMEILEEVYSNYYPIENGSAIVCENDPFDKYHGRLDHVFLGLAKKGGANSFHYMHSFRDRTEAEIIDAFKKAPAIIFCSSYKDVDWWELMIRCIIKSKSKAVVIGKASDGNWEGDRLCRERFKLCCDMAAKFGVTVTS